MAFHMFSANRKYKNIGNTLVLSFSTKCIPCEVAIIVELRSHWCLIQIYNYTKICTCWFGPKLVLPIYIYANMLRLLFLWYVCKCMHLLPRFFLKLWLYTLDKFSKLIVHLLTVHISLTKPARNQNILTNHENIADSSFFSILFSIALDTLTINVWVNSIYLCA